MASYETRGSSTRAIVRVPGGGKVTATFDTMGEASAWAKAIEAKKGQVQLEPHQAAGVTVGRLFEEYEELAKQADAGRWNVYRLRALLVDPLAEMKLGEVTTHHIEQWVDRRRTIPSSRTGKPVTGGTVQRELNLISGAFNWARKSRRWIEVNPCHGVGKVAGSRKTRKPQSLTSAQIQAMRIATGYDADPQLRTKTSRVGAAWLLSLETGMRSGEILRLRPAHYRRDRKTVHVAAEERGGRKGSKSATVDASRHVPLTARAIELLDQLLATMPADQEADPLSGMLLPPYIVGLNDRQRDSLFRKARTQAGMREFTYHDSKHEACTRLSKFLDILELSHAIGTKDIRLLRDTYYINDASAAASRLPAQLVA